MSTHTEKERAFTRMQHAYGESDCACTSVNSRITNARNSSIAWKRATWPETTGSSRVS